MAVSRAISRTPAAKSWEVWELKVRWPALLTHDAKTGFGTLLVAASFHREGPV